MAARAEASFAAVSPAAVSVSARSSSPCLMESEMPLDALRSWFVPASTFSRFSSSSFCASSSCFLASSIALSMASAIFAFILSSLASLTSMVIVRSIMPPVVMLATPVVPSSAGMTVSLANRESS